MNRVGRLLSRPPLEQAFQRQDLSMTEPRWLDREAAAAYICVRVDELARLERHGKLPPASYHLGPRTPRWDRLALDAVFAGPIASTASTDIDTAVAALVEDIHRGGLSRRRRSVHAANQK